MPEFYSNMCLQDHQRHDSGYGQILNKMDDPRGLLLSGIFSHSGSQECLELAGFWLQACFRSHTSCFRNQEILSVLPTRVLHVGDSLRNPTLHLGVNKLDRWVALGYCWGGNSDFVL